MRSRAARPLPAMSARRDGFQLFVIIFLTSFLTCVLCICCVYRVFKRLCRPARRGPVVQQTNWLAQLERASRRGRAGYGSWRTGHRGQDGDAASENGRPTAPPLQPTPDDPPPFPRRPEDDPPPSYAEVMGRAGGGGSTETHDCAASTQEAVLARTAMAGSLETLVFVIAVIVLIALCQLCYWATNDSGRMDEESGRWWSASASNGAEGPPAPRDTRDTLPLAYSGPG
ncbi:hypothetical protein FJT64_018785 [Amphibalanus amphitrite]|uniref:Uncharacterized protein n=1 Tax=Amphibalanus amphitrite TaxID=1232801 RepID=A0A6A4WXW3_AMPAM|nr:hypothetical protein FJT64_018785 [Amphibalanus amphitrite]